LVAFYFDFNVIIIYNVEQLKVQMIDQPSLAILIDPWFLGRFGNESPSEKLYKRIVSFLNNNQYIKTVVLASYNCKSEKILESALWYKNYNSFINNNANRMIKDLDHVHRVCLQVGNTTSDTHKTDPTILNYVNPDKFQIAMLWGWELSHYLSINADIKNVYVLGSAWSDCVKNRPLGYEALNEFKNINVLTNTDCISDTQGSVNLENDTCWKKLENKIYLLKNE